MTLTPNDKRIKTRSYNGVPPVVRVQEDEIVTETILDTLKALPHKIMESFKTGMHAAAEYAKQGIDYIEANPILKYSIIAVAVLIFIYVLYALFMHFYGEEVEKEQEELVAEVVEKNTRYGIASDSKQRLDYRVDYQQEMLLEQQTGSYNY